MLASVLVEETLSTLLQFDFTRAVEDRGRTYSDS